MPSNSLLSYDEWGEVVEPDTPWLIPGLLHVGGGAIMHGTRSTYKTFHLMRLCLDLAVGRPPMGRWEGGEPMTTIMFQGEGSATDWKARLNAVREQYGSVPNFYSYHSHTLWGDTDEGAARIVNIISAIRPQLVVFDPLIRFFTGDDSDAAAVDRWINRWNDWRDNYETAVIISHHDRGQRTYGYQGKTIAIDDGMNEMRGRSELPDWADLVIGTQKKGEFGMMTVQKVRDDEPPGRSFKYIWKDGMMVPADVDADAKELLVQLVWKMPMPKGGLCKEVETRTGLSNRTVRRHMNDLVAVGVLWYKPQGSLTMVGRVK